VLYGKHLQAILYGRTLTLQSIKYKEKRQTAKMPKTKNHKQNTKHENI
jgi:hypothetical protein